jgi:molybdate transport system ATP-binding protein
MNHYAFYLSNFENKQGLITQIRLGTFVKGIDTKNCELYSEVALNSFIREEEIHGHFDVISSGAKKNLVKYSDGEKRKALLSYIISKKPKYIIVDNILDNLDINAQAEIVKTLHSLKESITILQIANRKSDILDFIENIYVQNGTSWEVISRMNIEEVVDTRPAYVIPDAYEKIEVSGDSLVKLKNVFVAYDGVPIVKNIYWEVQKGEFWQMKGPNGVGKSTILSLISGDNARAYGQDITLFGVKKGGGESIWELKKKVGYFSSELKRGFQRRESIEKMILSGFFDSIGLYTQPSKRQIEITVQWLDLLGLYEIRKKNFSFLTLGQQRMILIARAMVKHPPLLILDEPTAGLDDHAALLFTQLINKISKETETSIIYVSHRKEKGLEPTYIFELFPTESGAIGKIQQ